MRILLLLTVMLCQLLTLYTFQAWAGPANSRAQVLAQPSGEQFLATLHGDEWFNWRTFETGSVILLGTDGFWQYATLKGNDLLPMGERVAIDPHPEGNLSVEGLINWRQEQLAESVETSLSLPSPGLITNATLDGVSLSTVETSLNPKTLCLLVEFSDIGLLHDEQTWSDFLFGDTGSINSYYREVSQADFAFEPAAERYGVSGDGIVRVMLPYPHPDTGSQITRDNQLIVRDALEAADPYVDYASFDSNGDGAISSAELHLVVVVSGYDASYGSGFPSIWAHWWSLSGKTIAKLDGVVLGDADFGGSYVQLGENQGDHMATIGIPAHELGHELGLPDLYDYDGSSLGVGVHSLMGTGCWAYVDGQYLGASPTHLDPWSKLKLDFVIARTVVSSDDLWLPAAATGQYDVVRVPSIDPNQYFLLENRQFTGFDQGLANVCNSGGIAVWHIDETVIAQRATSGINNDENHKGVDLEEANQGLLGYSQLDANEYRNYDHYYYLGNATLFAPDTVPGSNLYDGTVTGINVSVEESASDLMLGTLFLATADITPPLVSFTSPLDNIANVDLNETVIVLFNEDVVPGPNWGDMSLASPNGSVAVSCSLNGRILTLEPQTELTRGTSYTVVLPVAGVTDLVGNQFAESYSFGFTTSRH